MARVSSASNSARLSAAGSAEIDAYASPSAISLEDEEEDEDELGT